MAYNKLWESEFDNIVSKRDILQDIIINQLKLEVHDTFKEDEKKTTNCEAVNGEDKVNKKYLDEKFKKINVHISYIENDYKEFKLEYHKQSVEEILVQRAVKITIQIFYDTLFVCLISFEKLMRD